MHIVLGFLTSLITILYLLDRMGVNLGGLNPFYWRRRRAWAKKYGGDPIYAIEDPMEVAALSSNDHLSTDQTELIQSVRKHHPTQASKGGIWG